MRQPDVNFPTGTGGLLPQGRCKGNVPSVNDERPEHVLLWEEVNSIRPLEGSLLLAPVTQIVRRSEGMEPM